LAFNSDVKKSFIAEDKEVADKVKDKIAIATNETATKYFESFKVDLLPYVLLLNKNGEIVAANLQYDQAKNMITKFIKKDKAREAAVAP